MWDIYTRHTATQGWGEFNPRNFSYCTNLSLSPFQSLSLYSPTINPSSFPYILALFSSPLFLSSGLGFLFARAAPPAGGGHIRGENIAIMLERAEKCSNTEKGGGVDGNFFFLKLRLGGGGVCSTS